MITTTTYNRSQIAKQAWNFVKKLGKSLSEAMKMAWAKAKDDAFRKIKALHFECEILPFKRRLLSEGKSYDGVVVKLTDRNTFHQGLVSWSPNVYPELVNFTGYLISVSGSWFELFDSEQFKKDIDSICYRIDGKKVTCNFDKVYRWAIEDVDLAIILAIAKKYKLTILS